MDAYSQAPPLLLARAVKLYMSGRVHFPKNDPGTPPEGKDGFVIFRRVVLDPPGGTSLTAKALFQVFFRFARFSPGVNEKLSLIPIPLIIAQPGFISKTWLFNHETRMFQGVYEWSGVEEAKHYWDSLPMRLMRGRAVKETLRYTVTEVDSAH